MVAGGHVPGGASSVLREDAWMLDLSPLAASQSQQVSWIHEPYSELPNRLGAALVWDEIGQRSLLVGGFADEWKPSIWSMDLGGAVTEVSASGVEQQWALPELTGTTLFNKDAHRQTQAVILKGKNGHRSLLVVAPNLPAPMTVGLHETQTGAWQPAPRYVGSALQPVVSIGDPLCLAVTPDGSRALLVQEDGTTWWVEEDGTTAVLHAIGSQGDGSAVPRRDAVCVVDDANVLHILGGQLGGTGTAPYVTADVPELGADPTPTVPEDVTWTTHTVAPANEAAFSRVAAFGFWHADSKTIVLGGGWVPLEVSSQKHRKGLIDVWAYSPSSQLATRLDAADVPQGRIGAAQGWRNKTGEWCVAGGLTYDLPDVADGDTRAVPVTDAWCVNPAGVWQKVGDNILYAFGIAGIDTAADRFVLASGFALQPNVEVPNLEAMWTGGLPVKKVAANTFDDMDPPWRPSTKIVTLDLTTHQQTTVAGQSPYALSASSVALDPLRNRLIISGGFDKKKETHVFLALDMATLTWTDLGAKVPQSGFCGGECHPYDRYGAPILYNPVMDVVAVTAGSLRAGDGSLGQDTGVNGDLGCMGFGGNTLWLGQTLTPSFLPMYVPNFADDAHTKPLLQQYFGGPVFVPVLFDWLGGRAWIAAQLRGVPDFGGPNLTPCTNPADQQWTGAGTQVSLAVGLCNQFDPKSVTAKLEPQQIATPSAMILSAAYFHVPTSQAWLFSGLEPDGSVAPGLWQLAQTCEKP